MRTISFSAVEILPSLLDKSKTQTIRPAWKDKIPSMGPAMKLPFHKPPRFKVGDKARLYWKQRSQYKWFDSEGNGCNRQYSTFSKILGVVKITEVFEIEIGRGNIGFYIQKGNAYVEYGNLGLRKNITLSERDGFKSAENMFKYFDENYDLSSPKKFFVYRWKWNK